MYSAYDNAQTFVPPLADSPQQQGHFDNMRRTPSSPMPNRPFSPVLVLRWVMCFAAGTLWFLTGCTPSMIKGTEIPATQDNQDVHSVLMDYQEAFQKKKWSSLLRLISPRYHETKGTADPDDDYGYDYVKKKLLSPSFQALKVYAFYIRVEKITYPTPNEAQVILLTRAVYQYPRGQYNAGWDRDVNRHIMRLERYRGRWMIVRGL